MDNIKKHLEQAEKKLHAEWQEKEKQILDDIERTKKEITDLAASGEFSPYSILDFENDSLDGKEEMQNLPELVRIGKLNPINLPGNTPALDIPMLLPFSENAVAFVLNENDKRDTYMVFSLIAFRLMLSLPLNLAKFRFVDNNLGRDFALMNKIDREKVDYVIVANQQDMNRLFADLEQVVSDAYKKHLATFPSLKDYNKTAGEMREAYHFVFISNFPAGFTTETAEKLYVLINNGNAAKAGVYLFFSIDRNEKSPYGVDIAKFSESTTNIYQTADEFFNKEARTRVIEKDFSSETKNHKTSKNDDIFNW